MTKLRAGLIQMSLKMDASRAPVEIREAMVAAHVPFVSLPLVFTARRVIGQPRSHSTVAP